ncbi:adenylosuccinate lyase [Coxiella endosymbiont of Amblyomma americanum]|uniref:adenylosuccinate lyase n=1 Tax=Coxiella endosymbiont of Amblyomma americanum TaxID=325775 RepID=UPI00057C64E5|nr:adenylosuccinate lyase [Coxiella endosymbiont of Amblyomma americanum]AJC50548.1 adenylosuccinate lyase [Coxiella endosymbiont of Amblyomma americanum]AUJ58883.1 adenylosuccinate lyase [Coxiella-like endosymbiont of Amblyomma americanum]
MKLKPLTALSPLDGRYQKKLSDLRPIFSEYGLVKCRVFIEIQWLLFLSCENSFSEIPKLTALDRKRLEEISKSFDIKSAEIIKKIEKTTNHDVKAVEYYLQHQLKKEKIFSDLIYFVHFGCTSEDINNLSYALLIDEARKKVLSPIIRKIGLYLQNMAINYADLSLLSHTHGQPASPTTLGKEFANTVKRIHTQYQYFINMKLSAKINGAVGNFNAHRAAYPDFDWLNFAKQFVESLGLEFNEYTTQIEPHDRLSELLQSLIRLNNVLIDFCQDMWGYISIGYFFQNTIKNEVGSSTMPHKVNPIDFENAEGNLGLANALADHMANKLPISRWQRDLTDSTVMRNLGSVFGYSLVAYKALFKGLTKIIANENRIKEDLNAHWEVLTEAIQTVMRRYGIPGAYEQLKTLTQDKFINKNQLKKFIDELPIPQETKEYLKSLTPNCYTGFASSLATKVRHLQWN